MRPPTRIAPSITRPLVVQRNAPRWLKMLEKHGYLTAT
ncbi:hypothetical protein TVNIR_0445 [Thioalkalivibrio nitratireducens DSM 14787]|uniref:Uncharacterized protein n=1 Tax=Thioalkalivibrio nitratireducens (strain DSM 14787 / UNIQEM 213 / ALEN2) TaxID=1255043 RepID=L0DT25_THIND|nr:hypothetical protein TVNIR_0445 [Thioalkalivibrio nitratireducens DSM 14787]